MDPTPAPDTLAPDTPERLTRIVGHPLVRIALPILVAVVAIAALHGLVSEVSWRAVKTDLAMAPRPALITAVLFTVLSFAGITCYDVIAVRHAGAGKVPMRAAAFAGATGFAVSNLLGFSYLTGTAIRMRIYGSYGLDAARVAAIFATAWVAFWLGLTAIMGVLLVLHPAGLEGMFRLGRWAEIGIGAALVAALGVILLWLQRGLREFRILGQRIVLPPANLAVMLTVAAVVDMIGAGLALYILLPADLVNGFPVFFVIYVAAIALGVLSHAPGGLGVFEATIIAGLGAAGRSDVLAALVLYRLVYTVLPFAVATLGLAFAWGHAQRTKVSAAANWSYRIARPLVPPVAAGIALMSGLVLLVSGNLPADNARLGVLGEIMPLPFIEASHLIGSVTGLLLIVIARGLYLRLHRAWVIATALMTVGLAASLSKGLDWEEALSMVATISVLWAFRSAFYRVSTASVFRLNAAWFVSVVALLVPVFWIGFFAFKNVAYSDSMWWEFALRGDASRFLRTLVAVGVVLAVISLNSLVMSRGRRIAPEPVPDTVRRLVAQSPDSDAGIALMGDKAFLIAADDSAFLAYADTGRSLIAKGDPVGDAAACKQLIWDLRQKADRMGRRCAFYAVSPKYLPTYLDMGLSILKIGEVAHVDLAGFTLDGSAKKDFRHAKARAAREGYAFGVIPRADVPDHLEELRAISDSWLEMKQGEEKAFSMGSFTDDFVRNFDVAVLRKVDTGQIVAFANLMQGVDKADISIDMMRYRAGGPNFVMDALFGELMLWAAAEGYRAFSLGAAPFSGLESRQLASAWNRIGGFVYQHGKHLYHFEGLRSFKQKFDPVWTPNYLASPGGLAVPRILYEVNVLISGGVRGLIR